MIISPAQQRGRDFALILQSLINLGYDIEWRVINAAEYGMPQRRKRTYILAYSPSCPIYKQINEPSKWIFEEGIFAKAFPVQPLQGSTCGTHLLLKNSKSDLSELSTEFNKNNTLRPFSNAGLMVGGKYWTYKTEPDYCGSRMVLEDVLAKGKDRELITEDYYISPSDLPKWEYLKGGKKEVRKTRSGAEFTYSEGSMAFPDLLDRPSRTIITSEGGSTPSRFKHVIIDPENGRYRRLIPLELERLNMFPDNHTIGETDTKRAFFMGNALVCGIITKVGEELYRALNA
jgi:DNA (cytosine-5)-methyltransferase 1